MNKMIKSLNELKVAFQNVNQEWSRCNEMNELVKADYPFEDSFDELNIKVTNWVDDVTAELKEK